MTRPCTPADLTVCECAITGDGTHTSEWLKMLLIQDIDMAKIASEPTWEALELQNCLWEHALRPPSFLYTL